MVLSIIFKLSLLQPFIAGRRKHLVTGGYDWTSELTESFALICRHWEWTLVRYGQPVKAMSKGFMHPRTSDGVKNQSPGVEFPLADG